jgi:MFS family permease
VIEGLAPRGKLTEAFSWVGSALATGAAIGSMIVGVVLDELGLRSGQALGIIAGVASVIIVYTWGRYLRTERDPVHIG